MHILPVSSDFASSAGNAVLLGDVIAAAGIGVAHVHPASGRVDFDSVGSALFALDESVSWRRLYRRCDKAGREWLRAVIRRVSQGETALDPVKFQLVGNDGRQRWIACRPRKSARHCENGCWVASLSDITTEQVELEALKQREEHLRYTIEMNPELPWIADPNGRVLDFTDRWLTATGLTRESAKGEGWMSAVHPDEVEFVRSSIEHSVVSGTPFDVRVQIRVDNVGYRWMRARGFPRRDEQGRIMRWYGYTEDIHEHVLVEHKIRWTAEHDALTGLPNRMLFNRRLEESIDQALQKPARVGLLTLDVDQFKEVNDLLGHDAGDALLCGFAQKLLLALPGTSTIARIGGDEFAVLLPDIDAAQDVVTHCDAIFEALKEPFRFAGRNVEFRTSIGAAIYPDHGQRSSELMKHTDLALYAAKSAGRGRLTMFEPSMHDEMRRRVAMVNRGREAVEEGGIIPYYQPKVSLITGKIVGFEALLRWRDRRGRVFLPETISAAFDELDLAEAMGSAMLDNVLADMVHWREQGLAFGHVAINASPAEFRRHELAERVINGLENAGVSPRHLQLEVTEGVFLGRGSDNVEATIRRLHDYGINIALDDFGTGFASLSHLRKFPVDTLKIDRSFVSDVAHMTDDATIVAAIVSLGRNLGMRVVAEGVETPEQAAALRDQGCEYGQGYLFCRPVPSAEIPGLLRNWQANVDWDSKVAGRLLPDCRSVG